MKVDVAVGMWYTEDTSLHSEGGLCVRKDAELIRNLSTCKLLRVSDTPSLTRIVHPHTASVGLLRFRASGTGRHPQWPTVTLDNVHAHILSNIPPRVEDTIF